MDIRGYVERIGPTQIQGWAYTPEAENLPLGVRASLDELVIGLGTASEYREDLRHQGFGRGDHGFTITFDVPVSPDDIDQVEVVAVAPGGVTHRLGLTQVGQKAVAAHKARVQRAAAPAPLNLATFTVARARPVREARAAAPRRKPSLAEAPAPAQWAPSFDITPFDLGPAGPAIGGAASGTVIPMLNQPPSLKIFILGAARSGTSAMFIALAEVLKLPGYGESHVMPAFQRMIFHLRQYTELFANVPEGVAVKRLDAGEVERLLHDYARTFYATMFTNQSFIDKTPTGEAIYGATTIEQVFPDARLVVMRRNGIEVVKSFRLKFATAFEQACLAWREAMSGILMARQRCRRIIEVDQFDMANAPFDTARRLSAWLDRPEAAEPLGRLFGSTRVEKSSTHDWSQRLRLADMDWSADEKNTFRDTCGPMMEAFGYPM